MECGQSQIYNSLGTWLIEETSSFKSVSQHYLDAWPHCSLGCLELKHLFFQQKCHQGTRPPGDAEVPWSGSAPRKTQQGEPSGVSGRIEVASSYLVTSEWEVLLLFCFLRMPSILLAIHDGKISEDSQRLWDAAPQYSMPRSFSSLSNTQDCQT